MLYFKHHMKTPTQKIPSSVYTLLVVVVIVNIIATFIIIKFFS